MSFSTNAASASLSRAIFHLLMKEPFYAHLVQGFQREFTNSLPTAAVMVERSSVKLVINPAFFEQLTSLSKQYGLLKHELLHVVFHHLFREERSKCSALVYNIAADLVVNQCLNTEELPPGALLPERFAELKLEKNKTLMYYIDKLQSKQARGPYLTLLYDESHSYHEHWRSNIHRNELMEEAFVSSMVREILHKSMRHGTLPGGLQEVLKREGLYQSKGINWKQALRLFVSRTAQSCIRSTNNRVSKRYGSRQGIRISNRLRLMVAVDTSGSVTNEELQTFFQEIDLIYRSVDHITLVECDVIIQSIKAYKPSMEIEIHGRGGTDVNPVMKLFNETKPLHDGLIYFTDGYAPQPSIVTKNPCLMVMNTLTHKIKPSQQLFITHFNKI